LLNIAVALRGSPLFCFLSSSFSFLDCSSFDSSNFGHFTCRRHGNRAFCPDLEAFSRLLLLFFLHFAEKDLFAASLFFGAFSISCHYSVVLSRLHYPPQIFQPMLPLNIAFGLLLPPFFRVPPNPLFLVSPGRTLNPMPVSATLMKMNRGHSRYGNVYGLPLFHPSSDDEIIHPPNWTHLRLRDTSLHSRDGSVPMILL